MKFLKIYSFDKYVSDIILLDFIYKRINIKDNMKKEVGFINNTYLNVNKYDYKILSKIYKIMRLNYFFFKYKVIKKVKKYLKGRIKNIFLQIKIFLSSFEVLMIFNFLCLYFFRVMLNYNGLFYILLKVRKEFIKIGFYWNDFNSRIKQIKETIQIKNDFIYKIDIYKLTLNLYIIYYNFFFDEVDIYLSFFGFNFFINENKYYFYIRVI